MTATKALLIIFGLATGHWTVLQFQALRPGMELWAAHKLVDDELSHGSTVGTGDSNKHLLLCVKQLADYETRTKKASELLTQISLASTDLK